MVAGPSWGQDGASTGSGSDSASEEAEVPTTAPTGVEVIHIKGKTVTAMETEVPASVTQFDPSTIRALGAQNRPEMVGFAAEVAGDLAQHVG